eukprot:g16998.t1
MALGWICFHVLLVQSVKIHLPQNDSTGLAATNLTEPKPLSSLRSSLLLSPSNVTGTQEEGASAKQNVDTGSFGFDLTKMSLKRFEPYMWLVAAASLLFAVLFELMHRHLAQIDLTLQPDYGAEHHEQKISQLFAGIWPLARPFFLETRSAWGYVTSIAVIGGVNLFLGMVLMVWHKEFWDSIEQKNISRFFPLLLDVAFLACARMVLSTYSDYIGMMLSIRWRQSMTQWLAPDNPDQRIQEDVRIFVEQSMVLGTGLTIAASQLLSRLPLLLLLSPTYAFGQFYCPGWLLYVSLLYSGLGTFLAHEVGKRLIVINFGLQKYEDWDDRSRQPEHGTRSCPPPPSFDSASFRYDVVQIRDHAEAIALYGSEAVEESRLNGRFEWIARVWWMLMSKTKQLNFFQSFYYQTSAIFPYLLLAPSYFKGQITLGSLFMLFDALGTVKGGFDWFLGSYATLTSYRATVDRLTNFVEALQAKPMGELQVLCGEFVLLSAPEGMGKSCFFRAMAGIWPHAEGDVFLPEDVLFVPQKSYIPQGSLKQALTYPSCASRFSDEEVNGALQALNLTVLEGRSLKEEADWAWGLEHD